MTGDVKLAVISILVWVGAAVAIAAIGWAAYAIAWVWDRFWITFGGGGRSALLEERKREARRAECLRQHPSNGGHCRRISHRR